MMGSVNKKIVLPLLLMVVLACSRWPGVFPANFSAVYAVLFCAGLYFPGRMAWILPLATLVVTDTVINFICYRNVDMSLWSMLGTMAPNYLAYVCILWIGRSLSDPKRSFAALLGGGILGAIVFYLLTNAIAWLTLIYSKDVGGFIQALTRGFPEFPSTLTFFRNTLMSGGLFTALFVGAAKVMASAESAQEKREPAPALEPDAADGEQTPEEAKT
jgi:hypothetical protein